MNARDKARLAVDDVIHTATNSVSSGEVADAASAIYEEIIRDVIQVLTFTKHRMETMQMSTKEIELLLRDLRAAIRRG